MQNPPPSPSKARMQQQQPPQVLWRLPCPSCFALSCAAAFRRILRSYGGGDNGHFSTPVKLECRRCSTTRRRRRGSSFASLTDRSRAATPRSFQRKSKVVNLLIKAMKPLHPARMAHSARLLRSRLASDPRLLLLLVLTPAIFVFIVLNLAGSDNQTVRTLPLPSFAAQLPISTSDWFARLPTFLHGGVKNDELLCESIPSSRPGDFQLQFCQPSSCRSSNPGQRLVRIIRIDPSHCIPRRTPSPDPTTQTLVSGPDTFRVSLTGHTRLSSEARPGEVTFVPRYPRSPPPSDEARPTCAYEFPFDVSYLGERGVGRLGVSVEWFWTKGEGALGWDDLEADSKTAGLESAGQDWSYHISERVQLVNSTSPSPSPSPPTPAPPGLTRPGALSSDATFVPWRSSLSPLQCASASHEQHIAPAALPKRLEDRFSPAELERYLASTPPCSRLDPLVSYSPDAPPPALNFSLPGESAVEPIRIQRGTWLPRSIEDLMLPSGLSAGLYGPHAFQPTGCRWGEMPSLTMGKEEVRRRWTAGPVGGRGGRRKVLFIGDSHARYLHHYFQAVYKQDAAYLASPQATKDRFDTQLADPDVPHSMNITYLWSTHLDATDNELGGQRCEAFRGAFDGVVLSVGHHFLVNQYQHPNDANYRYNWTASTWTDRVISTLDWLTACIAPQTPNDLKLVFVGPPAYRPPIVKSPSYGMDRRQNVRIWAWTYAAFARIRARYPDVGLVDQYSYTHTFLWDNPVDFHFFGTGAIEALAQDVSWKLGMEYELDPPVPDTSSDRDDSTHSRRAVRERHFGSARA